VNLAERLGYGPKERVLIIHADDVGVSHAANQAAFEGMASGSMTCGSILVPCPWFPEVAQHCREHPEADLGVHLTLTCEYPQYRWRALTGRETAPGLYDEQGYLWLTAAEAQAHISPEEAERELRAQVDAALAAGIDVTHLDTHMGTVLHPKFLAIYVSLGLEYRLPLFLVRPDRALLEKRGLESLWAQIEPQLLRVEEARLPILDEIVFETLDYAEETKEASYRQLFADLKPGVTHFIIHPARASDEMAAIAEDAASRARDCELFRDGSMREYLSGLGVKLIGYREIRDALRNGTLRS
jgi:predicted glycoside hydrolase/deacetylase ChbG (UPF0249 family)